MNVVAQPRLLVVDDEEAICEGCRRILTRQGFAVEKTSDPVKGLALAANTDYAAILLDIKMPAMTGLDFLSQLRLRRQDIPVILMTGFPSVPTAVSAISLGAAGYVTKPFTPEEITQAVHRFAIPGRTTEPDDAPAKSVGPGIRFPAPGTPTRFWHESWLREKSDSEYRTGAVLSGLVAHEVESIRLPRIGEVVWQGLPMASVLLRSGEVRTVPSPLTGVVQSVNLELPQHTDWLISDPCSQGWIADVCATRDEEELKNCITRGVLILASDVEAAERHLQRLQSIGCEARAYVGLGVGRGWEEMANRLATHRDEVVWMDAVSLREEGPSMTAQLNVLAPSVKVVVVGSSQSRWESAYRAQRIFYYSVEPFDKPEIVEVLDSAFAMPVVRRGRVNRNAAMEPIAQISITNRQGDNVTLVATPGMLFRNSGLGAEIRGLIYDRLYPVQTIPGKASIAPRDILNVAQKCDRVIVLESKDAGRLPGFLVRDKGAELASLSGEDASKVTTLTVQPPGNDACLDTMDGRTITQLAKHIIDVMATA
ncbi:MAG: response regulator [Pirellulaceae bacterium]